LQRAALVGPPDILVTTPACIPKIKCFSAEALDDSLEILVLDEVRMLSNLLSSFIFIKFYFFSFVNVGA
jgi:hypothetical protein